MKKLMFLAVMAIASMGAYAQHAVGSITLQPKVALNIANLTDNGKSLTGPGRKSDDNRKAAAQKEQLQFFMCFRVRT